MPDLSDQQADLFVVEPVTQLDGSPAPQPGRLSEATWRERLGPPGMVALAEGLALLLCFFAPWFYFPNFNRTDLDLARPTLMNYSGLSAALGIAIGGPQPVAFFVHLWLIPVTAVALLALTWVYVQRRFSARLTLGSVVALSVLALLVELGFYAQVQWLKPVFFSGTPAGVDFMGVAWGFWLAVAVNMVIIAVCTYHLRVAHKTPVGQNV